MNSENPTAQGSSSDVKPPIKISIITVSFNSELTIRSTIESVTEQSYAHIEHVFVDGRSTDRTLELIEEHRGANSVVNCERDEGIYDAFNKGIRQASGDVIGFLHSDDVFAGPWVIETIARNFVDPDVHGVYGDLQYLSQSDPSRVLRNWSTKPFSEGQLRWGWMAPHPTLYVRKEWLESLGGFDAAYRISGDYRFMLALFSDPYFTATYIPEVLVKMRAGGISNKSLKNLIWKSGEDLRAIKESGVGGLHTLVAKNVRKLRQLF